MSVFARPICQSRRRSAAAMVIRRKLYDLIWKRTIASQMAAARLGADDG